MYDFPLLVPNSNSESPFLRVNLESNLADLPPLDNPPISRQFIFHNKMPKSGSTTMKHLLTILAKQNDFSLDHQRLCIDVETCEGNDDDGANGIKMIQKYINDTRNENDGKYLLLKHHHWLNMTQIGLEQERIENSPVIIRCSIICNLFAVRDSNLENRTSNCG